MLRCAQDLVNLCLGLVPVLEIEGTGVALFTNSVAERPQIPCIACYALGRPVEEVGLSLARLKLMRRSGVYSSYEKRPGVLVIETPGRSC